MRYKGFESIDNEGQKELRLVFPDGLDRHFFARMYCRGELMDRAGGGPELIWRSLSSNFNNIKLVAPHQVHGTHVIPADSSFALPLRPEADGVMIVPGSDSLASLRFADCCPVVIASDSPVPWMLMLHSGFAGTAKNIVRSALSSISGWYGEAMGKRTYGWTGPCICKECYSRKKDDPSTINALKIYSPANHFEKNGMIHFDISGEIRSQLMQCGLPYDNIFAVGDCTYCDNDFYYSFRAGDERSRIFLLGGNTTKEA